MSDLLDYRTLFLASGIVGGALLMLLAMQTRDPYPGFVRAVVGLDILSAAIVIGGIRGYVPDALLILQVTAVGSFALVDSGIRLFCATPRRGRWPYVYVLAAMLLQTYLFFTRPRYPRIVMNALLLITIFIDAALPLRNSSNDQYRADHNGSDCRCSQRIRNLNTPRLRSRSP